MTAGGVPLGTCIQLGKVFRPPPRIGAYRASNLYRNCGRAGHARRSGRNGAKICANPRGAHRNAQGSARTIRSAPTINRTTAAAIVPRMELRATAACSSQNELRNEETVSRSQPARAKLGTGRISEDGNFGCGAGPSKAARALRRSAGLLPVRLPLCLTMTEKTWLKSLKTLLRRF
jgi:hypothetical protein